MTENSVYQIYNHPNAFNLWLSGENPIWDQPFEQADNKKKKKDLGDEEMPNKNPSDDDNESDADDIMIDDDVEADE